MHTETRPSEIFIFFCITVASLLLLFMVKNAISTKVPGHDSPDFHNKQQIDTQLVQHQITDNYSISVQENQKDTTLFQENYKSNSKVISKSEHQGLPCNLEYPDGNDTLLWSLFRKLSHARSKQVRIMHFGDSQIEGDHISSTIRSHFQEDFGGFGAGMLPLVLPFGSVSVRIDGSPNWEMITRRYAAENLHYDKLFPVTGTVFRYRQSVESEALQMDEQAFIKFSQVHVSSVSARRFEIIRLLYRNNPSSVPVLLQQAGLSPLIDTLPATPGYNMATWNLKARRMDLSISLFEPESPEFIGFSTESRTGVIVDNIPLRGSSGLDFNKSDTASAVFLASQLHPDLLILQFGVNVAPFITSNYRFYENGLFNQLIFLKKYFPQAEIIVIGISDMAIMGDSGLESYPNLLLIKEAMRNAAFRANCSFWDLFTAMGGKNSMIKWANASPSLARKDFIHFNKRGADSVGRMFYNAFIKDYRKFYERNTPLFP